MQKHPTCSTCPKWMRQRGDQGICVKEPSQPVAMPMQVPGYDRYHKREVVETQFMAIGQQSPMKAGMVCSHHPQWAEYEAQWTPTTEAQPEPQAEPSAPPTNGKPQNRLIVPG